MSKIFKEIRLYTNGKVEIRTIESIYGINMSIMDFANNKSCGWSIACEEKNIKGATNKLYRHMKGRLERAKKEIDRKLQHIEKLNHSHVLKLMLNEQ